MAVGSMQFPGVDTMAKTGKEGSSIRADGRPGDGARPAGPRPPYARVTLKELARACGVSPSTASNALAGKPHVREGTREKVLRIAEEMGYAASPVARGLRMNRSWTIGLMVSDISNPFFSEIARGIEDVIIGQGWHLILANTDYDLDKQAYYMRAMHNHKVDGLVLACLGSDNEDVVELQRAGVNFVLLNRRHRRIEADLVGLNNVHGMIQAMDHLSGLGHRRIAVIRGPSDSTVTDERYAGYREGLKRAKLAEDPALVVDGDLTIPSGRAAVESLLALADPPTAILATNDLMALGVMQALMMRGLRVPQDMSVVGFDDTYVADLPMVSLTTVHCPCREIGQAAAELLLRRIGQKRRSSPKSVIFDPTLVIRGSTAPPCRSPRGGRSPQQLERVP